MAIHVDDVELVQSLDGELSAERRMQVAQHLESCAGCRERAGHLRATMSHIAALCRTDADESRAAVEHGRVALEAALRAASATPAPWWAAVVPDVGAWRRADGLAAAVATLGVCAAVLLGSSMVQRPSGATALPSGVLPERSLTPGAVAVLSADELCKGVRPSRFVADAVRRQVLHAYGMESAPASSYELDALITPELGGSTDAANLWPQRYRSAVWNAGVKDDLEELLPQMVCRREITLAQAQQDIASDWVAAYKRYFRTDAPLRAHVPSRDENGVELVLLPREAVLHPTTLHPTTLHLASR